MRPAGMLRLSSRSCFQPRFLTGDAIGTRSDVGRPALFAEKAQESFPGRALRNSGT